MMGGLRASALRRASVAMVAAVLCLPLAWAQNRQSQRARPAPHPQATRPQPPRSQPQNPRAERPPARSQNVPRRTYPESPQSRPTPQNVPQRQPYGRPPSNEGMPPVNSFTNRQWDNRPHYPGPPYLGPGTTRPVYPGYPSPIDAPPGHLQSWLDAHRNVPLQNQEQMLRHDPSFRRLPQGEQQRLVQQLRDVHRLTEQQRERRLARNEMLERLSPEERLRVTHSAQEWSTLPPDRQATMKQAFRDLRGVPRDQRSIVLNSERYKEQFSPQERKILTEMLKVEPYEPR